MTDRWLKNERKLGVVILARNMASRNNLNTLRCHSERFTSVIIFQSSTIQLLHCCCERKTFETTSPQLGILFKHATEIIERAEQAEHFSAKIQISEFILFCPEKRIRYNNMIMVTKLSLNIC